jgi:hypothetical protein
VVQHSTASKASQEVIVQENILVAKEPANCIFRFGWYAQYANEAVVPSIDSMKTENKSQIGHPKSLKSIVSFISIDLHIIVSPIQKRTRVK